MESRIQQAEEIIRAKNRLIEAMYNSDLEASWPKESSELQGIYETRYNVVLDADLN